MQSIFCKSIMPVNKARLFQALQNVEKLSIGNQWSRFLHAPMDYFLGVGYWKLIYPHTKKAWAKTANTFFGAKMHLPLPAGLDIFLTAGKTDPSEIALGKFLIKHLQAGDCFYDIGAHLGFYSLLAAQLVGENGTVISFEASANMFSHLQKNATSCPNIECINKAVSNKTERVEMVQFDIAYSEFNSLQQQQYENQTWFKKANAQTQNIEAISIDDFLLAQKRIPQIIKLDVEGAEAKVLEGAKSLLQNNAVLVAMEYVLDTRGNAEHEAAIAFAGKLGYAVYLIDELGEIYVDAIWKEKMKKSGLKSVNIVLKKG
jgi:FkbM family methyltransferase